MDLLARTCSTDRMNLARLFARGFVAAGGLIWLFMFAAANTAERYSDLSYTLSDVGDAFAGAAIPFVVVALIFVLGLYFERLTAALLVAGAVAVIVFGVFATWDAALWVGVVMLLVLPMVLAAALYLIAARTQRACEMQEGAAS